MVAAHHKSADNAVDLADAERDDSPNRPAVVVGLDGSDTSWHAFAWALGEAQRLDARLIAVLVSSTAAISTPVSLGIATGLNPCSFAEFQRGEQERALELSDAAISDGTRAGVNVTFLHRWGDPADELVKTARSSHAAVITVGRSTSLLHRIAGSTGRRLARKCEPIVVIVP